MQENVHVYIFSVKTTETRDLQCAVAAPVPAEVLAVLLPQRLLVAFALHTATTTAVSLVLCFAPVPRHVSAAPENKHNHVHTIVRTVF
jgi:hypothetical protein